MPAVAEYAKPASAFESRFDDQESSLGPQGLEGAQLYEKAREARQHWVERAQVLMAENALLVSGPDQEDDSWKYVPIRPNRVFYVQTRYVFVGEGSPRPFEWGNA